MPGIQDYALIGDCRSAALVSKGGELDWLCWPRFDSPPVFGRLLDSRAGRWRLSPAGPFTVERAYLPGTAVLETRFRTRTGALTLVDLMPVAPAADRRRMLVGDHEVLRIACCESGEVELVCELDARPDFGRARARASAVGELGVRIETGPAAVMWLRADVPVSAAEGGARARLRLSAGERARFSLVYADDGPAVLPLVGDASEHAVERTAQWWRRWCGRMRYDGPRRDMVLRSALTLKLLSYSPSGAIVAAPTTSLPERPRGDLNWDYRYCWLRDAALTAGALYGLGFSAEAEAWTHWLLHATRLTWPRLRPIYDVYGNRPPRERAVEGLEGYGGARPVRVGNLARDQVQFDVYGQVVEAAREHFLRDERMSRDERKMLCSIGEYVCEHWDEPDSGLWERRSRDRRNTHSMLLCWVALDRLARLHREGWLCRDHLERLEAERDRIAAEIRRRAWSERLQSYVDELDGDELDASVLAMSWLGFEPAGSGRMRSTYEALRRGLGAGPFLYRYRDGDSPGEGAFGVCGFWAVRHLAAGGGPYEDALGLFERILDYANDVGLFAEETDPASGEPLGNFPQAFTHVGLINAALALEARRAREPKAAAA
ncbi:MAG: glycoside hydrolase family 15 protein [Elusimicrobia bacterium]|nr:glycoside hydrolase family 15 protein [Elusimicrobiota bacterium]